MTLTKILQFLGSDYQKGTYFGFAVGFSCALAVMAGFLDYLAHSNPYLNPPQQEQLDAEQLN